MCIFEDLEKIIKKNSQVDNVVRLYVKFEFQKLYDIGAQNFAFETIHKSTTLMDYCKYFVTNSLIT